MLVVGMDAWLIEDEAVWVDGNRFADNTHLKLFINEYPFRGCKEMSSVNPR